MRAPARRLTERRAVVLAIAVAAALAAFASLVPASGHTQGTGYEAVPIAAFDRPVHVAVAPGEPRFLFVVEAAGRIRLLRDEVPRPRPFLDISDLVRSDPEDPGAGGEQGLLSVAFAPDYEQSRRFYVAYTDARGDVVVDEFMRSAANRVIADPATRRRVIGIPHRFAQNHNGGQLAFPPNGRLLFLSVGDGGAAPPGQPTGEPARQLGSLLGKLLRIDPLPHAGQPYRIPPSNPFVGAPGRDEIFAYGFRNPWRFSFDGGRIAIGDVGLRTEEEVDLLKLGDAAGANFGWPEYEGNFHIDPSRPGPHPPTFPIHTYSHDGGACAITGGFVIRDADLPELVGRYVYSDFCTGELRSLRPRLSPPGASGDAPIGVNVPNPSSFGQGFGGQIYISSLGGSVYRLESAAR